MRGKENKRMGLDNPPVFLLAVHQQLVEEEENPLLHVPGRNLEEDAVHEHLRAGVRDVGALRRDTRGGRLEKRRDKKMLRRCLLLQELFFSSSMDTSRLGRRGGITPAGRPAFSCSLSQGSVKTPLKADAR